MMSNQGNNELNNSTENLFNLIQATKTKNTPVLEPLKNEKHKKTDSAFAARFDDPMISPRDEMGIGLQQKNQRMQKTEYGRGFLSNMRTEDLDA